MRSRVVAAEAMRALSIASLVVGMSLAVVGFVMLWLAQSGMDVSR